jgi:hypothetical protein
MIWQDCVISAVNWCFAAALVPSLRPGGAGFSRLTAISNTVLLVILGCTLATLGLIGSAASSILTATLWAVIGVRSMRGRA